MEKLFLVFVGGGLGSVARYGVGVAYQRANLTGWPFGTLTVNAVGGLLMGVLVGWLAVKSGADSEKWRLMIAVGILGGFTTFSAFSLETLNLIDSKGWLQASLYVTVSVLLGVGGVLIGRMVARAVFA